MEFHCQKCNHITSGVIDSKVDPNLRRCIVCRSILIQCALCFLFTSVTETPEGLNCDLCHKPTNALQERKEV